MPRHQLTLELSVPPEQVFDFLARPTNLIQLAPPDLHLKLVQGPERLQLGSMLHWKARRMGVSQTLKNEVTAYEESVLIAEEQRQGPFKRWTFLHRFEAIATGTRLAEELTYEPPGGLLGMLVTAKMIHKELETLFTFRADRLRQAFGQSQSGPAHDARG
jgi:ligand-binding SRPBCC domain-containing protein